MGVLSGFVSDGAANMVKLADLLREGYAVQSVLCFAHSLSLLLHHFGEYFDRMNGVFRHLRTVVNYFRRSTKAAKALKSTGANLPRALSQTRFAYNVMAALEAVKMRKEMGHAFTELEGEGASGQQSSKRTRVEHASDDTAEDAGLADSCPPPFERAKAAFSHPRLFSDLKLFSDITTPIFLILRVFDTGYPLIGFHFWAWARMEELVDRHCEDDEIKAELVGIINRSWAKRHRAIESFAYLTNPFFQPVFSKQMAANETPFAYCADFEDDVIGTVQTLLLKVELIDGKIPKGDVGGYLDRRRREIDIDTEDPITERTLVVLEELKRFWRLQLTGLKLLQTRRLTAAVWWEDVVGTFPYLAPLCMMVHTMPSTSSRLERHFSGVALQQSGVGMNLAAERASMRAWATSMMRAGEQATSTDDYYAAIQRKVETMVRSIEACVEGKESPLAASVDELVIFSDNLDLNGGAYRHMAPEKSPAGDDEDVGASEGDVVEVDLTVGQPQEPETSSTEESAQDAFFAPSNDSASNGTTTTNGMVTMRGRRVRRHVFFDETCA